MSLADRAYLALRDRLISLQIRPGAPVNEGEIAAELGMGRTPVREAVKRLELEDLLEVFPRRGIFASDIRITDLAEISELRTEIEGYAASLAARRLNPGTAAELDALLVDLRKLSERSDPTRLMAVDGDVHRFIYRAAQNTYLATTAERLLNLSMRIWYLALDRVPDLAMHIEVHVALLEAVAARDPKRARRAAVDHVESFAHEIGAVLSGAAAVTNGAAEDRGTAAARSR